MCLPIKVDGLEKVTELNLLHAPDPTARAAAVKPPQNPLGKRKHEPYGDSFGVVSVEAIQGSSARSLPAPYSPLLTGRRLRRKPRKS